MKPRPEDFGYQAATGFDGESGWMLEGGEEAYNKAMEEWNKDLVDKAKEYRAFVDEDNKQDEINRRSSVMSFLTLVNSIIPSHTRWYLKKNQPSNYFRITYRQIGETPNAPIFEYRFQVWRKARTRMKVAVQFVISEEAFTRLSNSPGWEISQGNFFVFKNPLNGLNENE